ncbi:MULTISPECIES: hypothetical protein [unclassified Legionella]|uniref:hypothetical protein n=1 Tax=unclassified Legionella TaxID=2622702 RepID=UPI001E2BCDF2|nr:hypothetical protein [Legionella sp. 31fI33]MCC5014858.1 hypothetical protein [Legionella sp. 31fI33]
MSKEKQIREGGKLFALGLLACSFSTSAITKVMSRFAEDHVSEIHHYPSEKIAGFIKNVEEYALEQAGGHTGLLVTTDDWGFSRTSLVGNWADHPYSLRFPASQAFNYVFETDRLYVGYGHENPLHYKACEETLDQLEEITGPSLPKAEDYINQLPLSQKAKEKYIGELREALGDVKTNFEIYKELASIEYENGTKLWQYQSPCKLAEKCISRVTKKAKAEAEKFPLLDKALKDLASAAHKEGNPPIKEWAEEGQKMLERYLGDQEYSFESFEKDFDCHCRKPEIKDNVPSTLTRYVSKVLNAFERILSLFGKSGLAPSFFKNKDPLSLLDTFDAKDSLQEQRLPDPSFHPSKTKIKILAIPSDERGSNIRAVYNLLDNPLMKNQDGSVPKIIEAIKDLVGDINPESEEEIYDTIVKIREKISKNGDNEVNPHALAVINAFNQSSAHTFRNIRESLSDDPLRSAILDSQSESRLNL